MVSMRVFCYLLIFFIFQVHAKVSNAKLNSQVTEAADSKGVGVRTSMQITDKVSEDVIKHRKVLNQVNVKVEAKKNNGLEIESKETVRKKNNKKKKKKKLAKTVSLTADYSNPGHHPPRHN